MSHDQLKFWITCPNCKTAFGVEPRAIVQYLNRVLGALVADAPTVAASDPSALPTGRQAEPTPSGAVGEPTPKPKAPYKPPYRKWKR